MKKQHIKLSASERDQLLELIRKGFQPARVIKRAIALLSLDESKTFISVGKQVRVHHITVSNWAVRYNNEGLESALNDKPRSGRPIEIDGVERAKITALASSDAPEGYAKWSLRLLADKAVELGYCEHLSHNHAGIILKKNELKPHLKKT